ncbi:yippee-domain-containing protein [Laetiporus sulphureus 93-53]|uniref:Yippee-domain-containing protein n=1 Tax=Laetiporus sulphureus 93-53 TaxID=1314785 RepID=A0A165EVM9_9APHY|nr:yippee-domain-containing protein [Laetiporus sulphureus 93-53]KZT07860.1 yippee-domain-containing protein [Laetiporus sulphureus 93-53]
MTAISASRFSSVPILRTRSSMYKLSSHEESRSFVALTCRTCRAVVASERHLLCKGFRGYSGKAALFTDATNITLSKPSLLLMDTGAHTVQEFKCTACASYLGWKIVRAHERTETWKEGKFLLELALLEEASEPTGTQRWKDARESLVRASMLHRRTATDPRPLPAQRPAGPRDHSPALPLRDRTASMQA